LPAREIVKTLSKNFLKEASKLYLMPYSDDEEHSPSEFYYPDEISDETNDPNGKLKRENAEQNNNINSQEKIEEFIHNQKAKTTITKSDMKVFQRYLETVNKGEKQIEYLPKAELDHLLCKFFITVKFPEKFTTILY
jgi:hypothetical protein